MKTFVSEADKKERRDQLDFLSSTPSDRIEELGIEGLLAAFDRASKRVPAYRTLIKHENIDVTAITNIDVFKKSVPILDKRGTFGTHPIHSLCVDGNLEGLRSILTSSGQSGGDFSFGVNTAENLLNSSKSIDMGLQYLFNVDELSTLLINALPMGVKVNSKATVLAETSVRDDMVYAIIKKFANDFDQILLIGEGSFIKKIVEDGKELHNIDWSRLNIHFITGEEGIAENYRTYLANLIGVNDLDDKKSRFIMSSMGVAELDLNIFHETREAVHIRRLAHNDSALREALFGKQNFCPMLFVYYPHRCFVEALPSNMGQAELAISMISPEMKIPLLRYRSGDRGKLFSYVEMVDLLKQFGYLIEPQLKLPFVCVSGRGKYIQAQDGDLYPEAIKEALYADYRIAAIVTGNFRLSENDGQAQVEIQLRKGKIVHASTITNFLSHLATYSTVEPKIIFHKYEVFPYGLELDWERKFIYL